MRKKIILWLTTLLLSASIFTGCSDEDMQLIGQLLELVLEAGETAQTQTESQENWAEDGTDSGAISNIGDNSKETEGALETTAPEPSTKAPETTEATTEAATQAETEKETKAPTTEAETEPRITEDGEYLSLEDVALYIATYGHLPSNYLTKNEAQDLGWSSREGNLWEVAPGACIGGDRFGNYEGVLPKKSGRKYTECDVNYDGGYRTSERIVFSNDGLVYYTKDHYETFTLLYGEE